MNMETEVEPLEFLNLLIFTLSLSTTNFFIKHHNIDIHHDYDPRQRQHRHQLSHSPTANITATVTIGLTRTNSSHGEKCTHGEAASF